MTTQPSMQSPLFGILGINNINSCHTSNTASKPEQQGQGQLAPIPVTNPTNKTGWHGEGRTKKTSHHQHQKRTPTFTGDGAHSLHCPNETDETIPARGVIDAADNDVFVDTSWILWDEVESSGEEEALWHLCHKEAQGQTHIILVAAGPAVLQLLTPPVPQGPPPGNNPSHQEVATMDLQKEGDKRRI